MLLLCGVTTLPRWDRRMDVAGLRVRGRGGILFGSMASASPLRVVIQQRVLPPQRLAVFAELVEREGLEIRVLHGDNLPGEQIDGVPLHRVMLVPFFIGKHPVYWHAPQWRSAGRGGPDVLVMHWDIHGMSLVPALLRARWNRIPTILWGYSYAYEKRKWRRRVRRMIAGLATALLFHDAANAHVYVDEGWNPARIFVALDSIDQRPIQQLRTQGLRDQEQLRHFKAQHQLGPGPVVLARLQPHPDPRAPLPLQALAALLPTNPGMTLVIMGQASQRNALQTQAEMLGVAGQVRWAGPPATLEDVCPWYLASDFVVMPDPQPVSVLEALGFGKPLIVPAGSLPTAHTLSYQPADPDAPGSAGLYALQPEVNCLTYDGLDARSLAGVMGRLMGDGPLRRAMAELAHQTVLEDFNLSRMADGLEAAIRFAARRWAAQTEPATPQTPTPAVATPGSSAT